MEMKMTPFFVSRSRAKVSRGSMKVSQAAWLALPRLVIERMRPARSSSMSRRSASAWGVKLNLSLYTKPSLPVL